MSDIVWVYKDGLYGGYQINTSWLESEYKQETFHEMMEYYLNKQETFDEMMEYYLNKQETFDEMMEYYLNSEAVQWWKDINKSSWDK